jgi:hypothetical protein
MRRNLLTTVVEFLGAAAIVAGVAMVSVAVGYVVGGLFCLWYARNLAVSR